MATEAQRNPETGRFASPPPPPPATEADAAAMDRDDDESRATAGGTYTDPRIEMMKRARVKRAAEMGVALEDEPAAEPAKEGKDAEFRAETPAKIGEEPPPAAEEPVADPAAAEPEAPPAEAAPAKEASAIPDDAIVELVINGETKKLKFADAKKHLQLGLATTDTLARAKQIKADAEAELRAARAVRSVVGEPPAAPQAPAGPTPEEQAKAAMTAARTAKDTAFKTYTDAIRFGTDDEIATATKALREAEDTLDALRFEQARATAAPTQGPTVDPLLQREQVDSNRATSEYAGEFQKDQEAPLFRAAASMRLREEISRDLTNLGADANILAKLTDAELGEHHYRARSKGLVRPLKDVLFAAGQWAREELKSRTAPTPGATPLQERQSRKLGAPTPPPVAAGRAPEPQEEQPKTSKQLVEEMKARRGKA